jgi:hypothetical protein
MLAIVPSGESSSYVFCVPLVPSVGYHTSIGSLRFRAGSVSVNVRTPTFHGPTVLGSCSGSTATSGVATAASTLGSGGPSSPVVEPPLAEHAAIAIAAAIENELPAPDLFPDPDLDPDSQFDIPILVPCVVERIAFPRR